MSNQDDLKTINNKLDVIINLLSAQIVNDINQMEAINKLGQLGVNRNVIAKVIGTNASTVSVRLSQAKKKKKR